MLVCSWIGTDIWVDYEVGGDLVDMSMRLVCCTVMSLPFCLYFVMCLAEASVHLIATCAALKICSELSCCHSVTCDAGCSLCTIVWVRACSFNCSTTYFYRPWWSVFLEQCRFVFVPSIVEDMPDSFMDVKLYAISFHEKRMFWWNQLIRD